MKSLYKKHFLSFLYFFLPFLLLCPACAGEENIVDDMEDPEDCFYKFESGLDAVYGRWEPKVIIDQTTGDSTFYEIGEGHHGFIFTGRYADAFELRDNGEFDMYYVEDGRPCKDDISGTWAFNNMIIQYFSIVGDTLSTPVISLQEDELILEDTINFKPSIAIMRKQ